MKFNVGDCVQVTKSDPELGWWFIPEDLRNIPGTIVCFNRDGSYGFLLDKDKDKPAASWGFSFHVMPSMIEFTGGPW